MKKNNNQSALEVVLKVLARRESNRPMDARFWKNTRKIHFS